MIPSMRVALAQIDTTVGDVAGNAARVRAAYEQGRAAGADLIVTPELALGGYPPRDLLERPAFARACRTALEDLASVTLDGGALLVGTVEPRESHVGRGVFNAAALLQGGRIEAVVHKCLLPTYDVFDEARYFEPGDPKELRPLVIGGRRVGVTICEDVWNDADFWADRRYVLDPPDLLIEQGVDLLVNLSASPFHLGKQGLRRRMLAHLADEADVPVVHCNLVGGNDDLVFDGASFVAWPGGRIGGVARSFAEDLVVVDVDSPQDAEAPEPLSDQAAATEAITLGVRDYFAKCGFSSAVIGLSGGIDSAVTAALAVRALGKDNVTGITMPSRWSSGGSVSDSQELADNLGITLHQVPIEPAHTTYHAMLHGLWEAADLDPQTAGVTDQNIQARVRGNILMAWSNRTGSLVLSTGNKSELAVGYCTLYGDMAGGLAVISDLPKTLVYQVAEHLNADAGRTLVPLDTITKPPSAELAPDQKDTDNLPPYAELDAILEAYLENGLEAPAIAAATGLPGEQVDRVVRMVDRNEYKRRQAAPGIRVTHKAFGPGRRLPVAARFDYADLLRD
jgi:NAD+ synthase (glutamine-hydrolysing)